MVVSLDRTAADFRAVVGFMCLVRGGGAFDSVSDRTPGMQRHKGKAEKKQLGTLI